MNSIHLKYFYIVENVTIKTQITYTLFIMNITVANRHHTFYLYKTSKFIIISKTKDFKSYSQAKKIIINTLKNFSK